MSKTKRSLKNPTNEIIQNFIGTIPTLYAFADSHKKISFYNNEFRNKIKEKRLTGKKITDLFTTDEESLDKLKYKNIPLITQDRKEVNNYFISAFIHNKEKIGYSITSAEYPPVVLKEEENNNYSKKPLSQKEWENIFSLLIKDTSIEELTDDILERSINMADCSWGIVVLNDESAKQQVEYKIWDAKNLIKDKDSLIPEILSNLSYIIEWLKKNKKSINVLPHEKDRIAAGILKEENVENFVVFPCSIENKVIAVLILAKVKGLFNPSQINDLEQLASVFAFAMSFTIAEKLNATLESKLLQSQKFETLGKLAGGIAHDFNNLLSGIFGSLNLLKKKLSDRQEVFYLLENIENCSIRATDLTKGLLNYGKPTPKRKTVIKPADLLNELIKVILQTFPGDISIDRKIEKELYDIIGNSTEIYQVLLNLCINAKEAIKGKGLITIEAKNFTIDEKNSFDYPLLQKGNYVWFSVIDSGEGISEDNLAKIFDPYFSTKKKETGSGLGLYVTYGIVKAHNGHIDVTSRLNEGTRFDIFIPSYDKPKAIEKIKTEKIILLADDEIMLRDLLAELLESYNYEVVCVQNGLDVIKLLTEEIKADLLIIDYNMPEMDGITCINKIKELKLNIPIILSTGSSSVKEELDFNKLHIDYILNKPYEFEQMLEIVQKLI